MTASTTPTATKNVLFDIGGNATQTTVNGVTTVTTTSSSTNYAAPSQMTTGSMSSTANWTSFLGLSSATGPNVDTASFGYDGSARPSSTTSPTGATTSYTYFDTASPPYKTATTGTHWVQTDMDGFGHTIETWPTPLRAAVPSSPLSTIPVDARRSARSAKSRNPSRPTERSIGPPTPTMPRAALRASRCLMEARLLMSTKASV